MAEHVEQRRIRLAGHAALRTVRGQPESGLHYGFLLHAGLAHVTPLAGYRRRTASSRLQRTNDGGGLPGDTA
jgi:hypothetical protein